MRNIIIIIAVVIIFLILRNFMRQSPQKFASFLKQFGWVIAGGLFLFLLITGKLHWLFAVVAAAIPFLRKLTPLLRYAPFLHGLYARHRTNKANSAGPSTGQTSSVVTQYIEMSLDHDSGEMDGTIIKGCHKDKLLSQLSIEQLIQCMKDWQDDGESIALLQAYLDRMHPEWQADADYSGQSRYDTSVQNADMNREEALQILGLSSDAVEEDIIAAHKKLMQKLHPDRGGTNYLAAKINKAKEFLLSTK